MIGQKAALMMANMVLGTVLGLAAAILIGRYFDPAQAGQVTVALSVLGLLFFVADLGMGQAHVKRVSEGRDPGDCFATFAVFKLVATSVFVLLVAGGVWVYHGILGKPLVDTTLPVILAAVGYYVAKSLAEVGQSSFDARLETAKSQLAALTDTLMRVVLTALFALAMAALVHNDAWAARLVPEDSAFFAWVAREPGLALALATTLGAVGAATVSLTLLFRTLEWGRFRWALLKDYASFAFPLFVSGSIGLISTYIDGAVLGFFGGAVDAGVFGQVRRLPLVLAGVGTALSALLFPAVSGMLARHDVAGIQRTTDGALRYLSLLMVPAIAFTVVFPHDLIRLTLGEKWLSGAIALALITAGVLFVTMGHVHSFLLLGYDRAVVSAKVGVASAVVLILLNLALVPDDIRALGLDLPGLGITGAGIATLAANLVWYVGMRFATQRVTGYRERNHLWIHAGAAAVMVGLLAAIDRLLFPLVRWHHFLGYVALGALLYFALLVAWGELTRRDADFVRNTLHPLRMLHYVRGEIGRKRE